MRVIGTLLLIAMTTGAILCCFGAVYVKTVILPEASLDLGDFTLRENSVMYYQDDSGSTRSWDRCSPPSAPSGWSTRRSRRI